MSAGELQVLALSLQVSLLAIAVALPLAVLAAWVLSRLDFPGKSLLDGVIHLPLVLPPVVVGYLLIVTFGRNGIVGGWLHDVLGLTLIFNWTGAALAAGVMAFPLIVRPVRLSLDAVDRRLETAARTLGAGRLDVFRTITLPLTLPGILVGAVLGFARCLGEFGATITFAANIPGETRTIPLAIYTALQTPDGEAAATRLVVLSVAVSVLALAVSEWLARRIARGLGS